MVACAGSAGDAQARTLRFSQIFMRGSIQRVKLNRAFRTGGRQTSDHCTRTFNKNTRPIRIIEQFPKTVLHSGTLECKHLH
jgi:hypothetical protein